MPEKKIDGAILKEDLYKDVRRFLEKKVPTSVEPDDNLAESLETLEKEQEAPGKCKHYEVCDDRDWYCEKCREENESEPTKTKKYSEGKHINVGGIKKGHIDIGGIEKEEQEDNAMDIIDDYRKNREKYEDGEQDSKKSVPKSEEAFYKTDKEFIGDKAPTDLKEREIVHELKIWEAYFREVKKGNKTFEVRLNDRNFQVGDFLLLKEYDPDLEIYSGSEILCKVTYILDSPIYLKSGYIIMAIKEMR